MYNLKRLIGKDSDKRSKLSELLWPKANKKSQSVSVSNLINGKQKSFKLAWVIKICDYLGVDPNTLFGYPWRKKVILKKKKQ
jgi:DNA-binding Xre family transcriptional regulator